MQKNPNEAIRGTAVVLSNLIALFICYLIVSAYVASEKKPSQTIVKQTQTSCTDKKEN